MYLYNSFAALPEVAPEFRYTLFSNSQSNIPHQLYTQRQSKLNTENPIQRIFWEQFIQPTQLRDIDLLHAPAFVIPLSAFLPQVVTIFDLSFLFYPKRLKLARLYYLHLFTALSVRRAKRIIAISQSTAHDLQRIYGISNHLIDVAVPGIHPRYKPMPQNEIDAFRRGEGLPDRFLLHVGTLEPRKNLLLLLDAYARLSHAQRNRLPLVLIGGKGWDYEQIFQKIEELHLKDHIIRPGYIANDALPYWYNAATVFVFPSVYEGWSMPVTEALACGTPAITSNASSVPEAVGDGGICLPADEVDVWEQALNTCPFDEDWLATTSIKGLQYVKHFSWQSTAGLIADVYRKVLTK